MLFFIRVLWVSFFTLFGFTRKCIFRFQEKFITQKKNSNFNVMESKDDHPINGNVTKLKNDDVSEDLKDESESKLRFRFPTYEEFLQNNNNNGQSLSNTMLCENSDDNISDVDAKEDQKVSKIDTVAKCIHEFTLVEEVVEHEINSKVECVALENNVNSLDDSVHVSNAIKSGDFSPEKDSQEGAIASENNVNSLDDSVHVGNAIKSGEFSPEKDTQEGAIALENNVNSLDKSFHVGYVVKNGDFSPEKDTQEGAISVSFGGVRENSENMEVEMKEMSLDSTNNEDIVKDVSEFPTCDKSLTNNEEVMIIKAHVPSDDDNPLVSDSDSDSMAPSSESSFRSSFIDSLSDGILSDIDFEKAFEVDTSKEFDWNEVNSTKEALTQEDIESRNLSKGYEADDYDDEDEDILEELKRLEANLGGGDSKLEKEHGANTNNEAENKQTEEKTSSGEQLSSDSDEQNGLESQWEHQDLVEQLKMEIKKVRAIGLPTILEESESPKIADDLKPWKIKDKYHHQYGGSNTMDELHKFYKSYKERIRKLDILNYQKMYAIGFLKLKDPLQSFTKNKISTPALSTIISLDCWPCKPKTVSEIHQPVMKKFSRELESDLEMVYVGQMCLSWEFLRWQYGKALELWESDPHGIYRYNDVADRFQIFQVLLTRFLEDEAFQGPRVQTYVKNRCVHRNLLQVPLIRDDNTRDRRKERKVVSSKDAITSLQLVEIIEESIRILWRFIKTDKDVSNNNNVALLKCRRSSSVELQNPADASLLAEIRSTLQKKEKKLKELTRSEKCILRKLHKNEVEEETDHVLYFFSQVDMRLVSRVLNMPKISTEQLVWCSDKLSHIHFVDRKLVVDSSVLLFPCS